jgi:hypothetical protein
MFAYPKSGCHPLLLSLSGQRVSDLNAPCGLYSRDNTPFALRRKAWHPDSEYPDFRKLAPPNGKEVLGIGITNYTLSNVPFPFQNAVAVSAVAVDTVLPCHGIEERNQCVSSGHKNYEK